MLKDIFPQNAIDMKMLKKNSFLHKMFLNKEQKLYQISDKIGCMSQANVDYILQHNKEINAEKVEINPNSIQPNYFTLSENERNSILEKYTIPLDKKILVYGGNLGKPQGIDFLIETISENKNEDLFFLIVGNGTEFTKIEKWLTNCHKKNVLLIKSLPKIEYDKLVRVCNIGLIFLHKDFTIPNFPSRLLSYLEAGIPVIAATDTSTDIGITIEKANCGIWVKTGETKNMQIAIQKCLENKNEMSLNAKKLLENEFNVAISYQKIITSKLNVSVNC